MIGFNGVLGGKEHIPMHSGNSKWKFGFWGDNFVIVTV
jgi:hypothetical protein